MSSALRLLLFDIDGTLILSGGAGEAAIKDAMRVCFGSDANFDKVVLAGATDSSIASQLMQVNDIEPTPELVAKFLDSYLSVLEEKMKAHQGILLPGILPLLEMLQNHPGCVLGLLTGNIRRGAEIKLSHFGVWNFFEFGAFADDHHDRNELGKFARVRAMEKRGIEFSPEQIYVIGDTPRDIECGRAIGAKTVAIATGNYSVEDLSGHNPDFLFPDLGNPEEVVRVLLG